jgi:hypothetical protein
MNLSQLERVKTDLKQVNFGLNKIAGTYKWLTIDNRG